MADCRRVAPTDRRAAPDRTTKAATKNHPPRFAPARAVRVLDRAGDERSEPFLELKDRAIYCLEFHPHYRENGQIFVCSRTHPEGGAGINILSRFVVSRRKEDDRDNKPACDPASEERILEWPSDGHDGGAAVFGHDGMLYVSTGDGTADSDNNLTAQDASNLLGKILRIDVDHPAAGMKYAIPPDNPFLNVKGARGEIWSLGHRNPWRMTVDAKTGGLWVGNNGQDLWEFAHLIQPGDNCRLEHLRGKPPVLSQPATRTWPNRSAHRRTRPRRVSIADWRRRLLRSSTSKARRRIHLRRLFNRRDLGCSSRWHTRWFGIASWRRRRSISSPLQQVIAKNCSSSTTRLASTGSSSRRPMIPIAGFPANLSETGLFASVADHRPASGVVPYVVTAPGWTDGAVAERLVALPGDSRIERKAAANAMNGNFPKARCSFKLFRSRGIVATPVPHDGLRRGC